MSYLSPDYLLPAVCCLWVVADQLGIIPVKGRGTGHLDVAVMDAPEVAVAVVGNSLEQGGTATNRSLYLVMERKDLSLLSSYLASLLSYP